MPRSCSAAPLHRAMAALARAHGIDGRQSSLYVTAGVWERSGLGNGGLRPRLAFLQ